MAKNEMDEKINAIKDIMAELEEAMKWFANLRDAINSLPGEYENGK